VTATTLRAVKSATRNDWGAICWAGGRFHEAPNRPDLEILDRVGGGDSFASGLIYGLMQFGDAQKAVEYGAAHGALAMTTPGDTSMASLKEVEALVKGGAARGCSGSPRVFEFAVPDAGAPIHGGMSPCRRPALLNGVRNVAVPEAGAPMRLLARIWNVAVGRIN
jgi:hypothetical protein